MRKSDVLIIGAGAAGLSAGLYAARLGMNVIIIDEIGGGGQILQIDNLENYPGVFPAIKGGDYIETLLNQTRHFGVEIIQATVSSIDKKNNMFFVKAGNNEFLASSLIVATGAEHSKLGIPGEKELSGAGVSYCAICDGPFFKNKKVAVIGGGDSACTEALYLAGIASHVDIIHRRNDFRATKAIAERVFNNDKINVHFNSVAKKISGSSFVENLEIENSATGEISILPESAVFILIGMAPRTALLETLPKDKAGYFITDEKMATVVPGLFIAGDVRSKPLRQIVTAASDGAIAGHSAAEYVTGL
ncbi:MAG: thioredoxin-disulfide reductase [Spirochaetia bacterium]|nr:thioredoxin-disulfide reductase [Spirochaetia bacterium]